MTAVAEKAPTKPTEDTTSSSLISEPEEITLEELKARVFELHTMFGPTRLTRIWTDLLKAAYRAQDFTIGFNVNGVPAFTRAVFDERRLLRPQWKFHAENVDELFAGGCFFGPCGDFLPEELYRLYSATHHMAGMFDEELLEEVECEGVEEDDQ